MFTVVLCTAPLAEARTLADTLVSEKLVACVNIVDVDSVFRWEGKTEAEKEALLVMKTVTAGINNLTERIRQVHSYDVPEVIALPVTGGMEAYLNWVRESVE